MNFKRVLLIYFFAVAGLLICSVPANATFSDFCFQPMSNPIRTKEDYFRLSFQNLYSDLDSVAYNIFLLELAYTLQYDDTPLVKITEELQYEKYQYLLVMHICVLLTQAYIDYGYLFMKETPYFFNTMFFEDYLDGYEVSAEYFEAARGWWMEAIKFAQGADSYFGVHLDDQFYGYNFDFEDEMYQIKVGELDYLPIIDDLFERIDENRVAISNFMDSQ